MLRVAAAQFFAQLWIEALPEAGQIGGCLYGPLVRREQMDNQRNLVASDARALADAEEILQPRCDPGRLAAFVMDGRVAAAGQAQTGWSELLERLRAGALFEELHQVGGHFF